MSDTDRNVVCSTCGKTFVFTAGEQEFYRQKGFLSPPKRCPDCRRERRDRQRVAESQVYRAPAFQSDPSPRARAPGVIYRSPAFREYDVASDRSRNQSKKLTYPATCAQCGTQAQLPFRPVEGKEYYCRDCYRERKGGGSTRLPP